MSLKKKKPKEIKRGCEAFIVKDRLYLEYGITSKEYAEKLKKQKGVCWLCDAAPKSKSLNVDHRHIKGYKKLPPGEKKKEVRGLLCFNCNYMLGWIEHKLNCRQILKKVNEYFSVFKMKGDK